MAENITLSEDADYFLWWEENDGEEAGVIYGDGGYLDGRGRGDHIEGDAGSDTINGEGGNDTLYGGKRDADGRLAGYWGNDLLIGAEGDDTLVGGAGSDTLYGDYSRGGSGSDNIFAGGGDDVVYTGFGAGNDYAEGNGGNDTFFDQGGGTDRYFGGDGFDTISYAQSTIGLYIDVEVMNGTGIASGDNYDGIERFLGSLHNDEINGGRGDDNLEGLDGDDSFQGRAGADKLFGGAGNDTLNGGVGADDLNGGTGVDWASYRNATSMVVADFLYGGTTGEAAGDRYFELENLEGSRYDDHLGGNDVGNEIQGGYGADRMGGRGGNDRLFGGDGADYLSGDGGADYLDGGSGEDLVGYDGATAGVFVDFLDPSRNNGEAVGDAYMLVENIAGSRYRDILVTDGNANKIWGGAGSDDLYGLGGADTLYGEDGDDLLEGGENDDHLGGGIGNDTLRGGAGVDHMWGNTGNDNYEVTDAGDAVIESANEGHDTVFANVNYTLTDNVEDIILFGSASANGTGNGLANGMRGNDQANIIYGLGGADVIDGGIGNDTLDGGIGADTLYGGVGNDKFLVDNNLDVVVEQAGGGVDRVIASASYRLAVAAEIESLSTTGGSVAINLVGNNFIQTIVGNAGTNTVNGLGGNDTISALGGIDYLYGGLGNDRLMGGLGNDSFVFNTALNATTNRDTISDFHNVSGDNDTIRLENSIFTKLAATGALNAAFFKANATGTASDSNDYIVYNTTTGALSYDSNGNAAGGAVQFAIVTGHPALTAADFFVI